MKIKVGICGGLQSGKTSLFWQLAPIISSQPVSLISERHVSRSLGNDADVLNMSFYDKSDRETNSEFWQNNELDISIYCIDLSRELNQARIVQINYDIEQFSIRYPKRRLIIAATQNNITSTEAFDSLKKIVHPIPTVSTPELGQDPVALWEQLDTIALILKMENMRNKFPTTSNLYNLLDNFNHELQHLPLPTRSALIREVEQLVSALVAPQRDAKEHSIESFLENCDEIVCGKYNTVKNIAISIAIAAAVFIFAAGMGFFMGFSLGAWTGPGAFFTGLAVGSISAIAVVIGAPVLGIGAFGVSAHTLFKPLPVETAYNEIALEARAFSKS